VLVNTTPPTSLSDLDFPVNPNPFRFNAFLAPMCLLRTRRSWRTGRGLTGRRSTRIQNRLSLDDNGFDVARGHPGVTRNRGDCGRRKSDNNQPVHSDHSWAGGSLIRALGHRAGGRAVFDSPCLEPDSSRRVLVDEGGGNGITHHCACFTSHPGDSAGTCDYPAVRHQLEILRSDTPSFLGLLTLADIEGRDSVPAVGGNQVHVRTGADILVDRTEPDGRTHHDDNQHSNDLSIHGTNSFFVALQGRYEGDASGTSADYGLSRSSLYSSSLNLTSFLFKELFVFYSLVERPAVKSSEKLELCLLILLCSGPRGKFEPPISGDQKIQKTESPAAGPS